MTEKQQDLLGHDAAAETRIDHHPIIDAWVKARLIRVEGALHRFVPKQPGWCQALRNKLDLLVAKQMAVRPYDEGRVLAALQKHLKRLNYVYSIAEERRQVHLAKRRLRRKQAKLASKKPKLKVIAGGRHD